MPWTDSPPTEGPLLAERYRLVSRIGEGGMAGVYRAWDDRLRVWRAAKVLLPEFARKKKLRRRFEREAHTMARLEHRNLVRVVDVGTSGTLPFIVMELVPSGTLMQWVDRHGPMPPVMLVDAMIQVADGLAEVHRNGVIHRDIKPHNVLISEHGVCKLTDFGIAQESAEGLTRAGSVMGTMGYMAPEQRNDAASVDLRADIYGFAATMWKLLTGKPLRDLFMYTEDPALMKGIDEGLAEVLMACLAYSRDDRPGSMREVIDALSAVRETLSPDPASTPALPLQGQVQSVESSSDTFEEISAAFTLSEQSASSEAEERPSRPEPAVRTLPGLPYGLPQRMDVPVESEGSPSWLAEDDPTTDEAEFEIRPESSYVRGDESQEGQDPYRDEDVGDDPSTYRSQEAPSYLAEPEPEREPLPEPVAVTPPPRPPAPEPASALGLVVKLAGGGVVLFSLLLGALLFWSISSVSNAAQLADNRSTHLYDALNDERNICTELVRFDRRAQVLEGLFLDFSDHPREPERWERAMTFMEELDVYADLANGEESSDAQRVQARLTRLRAARSEAITARRQWIDASSSFPGVLTAIVGLSPSPRFDPKSLEVK